MKSWRQCAVSSPVMTGSQRWCQGWLGCRCEESALLVLLALYSAEARVSCREEVEKRCVSISTHAIGHQRTLLRAQTLTYDPALHSRVETVFSKHLGRRQRRGSASQKIDRTPNYHTDTSQDVHPTADCLLIYLLLERCHSHVGDDFYCDATGRRGVFDSD